MAKKLTPRGHCLWGNFDGVPLEPLWGPGVPKSKMWKGLRGVGKLEGTQRAGWECRGPTIFNISIKVFMGLTEPAVNPATSCQFQEYFYRDAEMAPGWPKAKIWTQCWKKQFNWKAARKNNSKQLGGHLKLLQGCPKHLGAYRK